MDGPDDYDSDEADDFQRKAKHYMKSVKTILDKDYTPRQRRATFGTSEVKSSYVPQPSALVKSESVKTIDVDNISVNTEERDMAKHMSKDQLLKFLYSKNFANITSPNKHTEYQ